MYMAERIYKLSPWCPPVLYLSRHIYKQKYLAEMETVFRALADQTRLRILGLLLTGEVCVCHIHDSLRISQPKASRHLAYLRQAGLVATRPRGLVDRITGSPNCAGPGPGCDRRPPFATR